MHFYGVFWELFMGMLCFYGVCWQVCDVLMHVYRVCWKPFMGMSYFLVQKYTHVKSLVFFRSLLLTAVANLMFCMYCLHILQIFVWFCACALQSVAAVPESSWYFNAIFRCFLRAVYGNVVFLQCLLTSVWCFNAILQGLLKTVYENVVFSRSKIHARHKSLVFFRSLAICSCSLRLCKALWGFWRYWKSLEWFERFWKALQALGGLVRLCAVLRGVERLWEVL